MRGILKRSIIIATSIFCCVTSYSQHRVGIGTNNPEGTLHINTSDVSESNIVFQTAFNGSSRATIQYLNRHFIFQTNEAFGSFWDFRAADGFPAVSIGSNGQIDMYGDLLMHYPRSIGVNTITPAARLHIVRNDVSGGGFNANALMILEDNASSYIQLSHPNNKETGILSGNASTGIRSAIVFQADSSIAFRTGGNSTKLLLTRLGSVGIGTATPAALLDVEGTVKIGINGNALNSIIRASILHNLPTITANSSYIDTFNVANVKTFSSVSVSPDGQLPDGLVIAYARVPGNDIIEVKFYNSTGAAINPVSMFYHITAIR